jgi:hypothetical protein
MADNHYRECAKLKPECKGLKKGVKGFHSCVRAKGCGKPKKAPKVPNKPSDATKARLTKPKKPTLSRIREVRKKVHTKTMEDFDAKTAEKRKAHKKNMEDFDAKIVEKAKRNRKLRAKVNAVKNPWMIHLAKFRAENPQFTGRQVMAEAKKTYKK